MLYLGEGKVKGVFGSERHAHCILEIEALPLWLGIVFENVVDRKIIPSAFVHYVEEGARKGIQQKGFPFAAMRVRLVGGSWHPVDSRPRDFEIAGEVAIRNAKPIEEI